MAGVRVTPDQAQSKWLTRLQAAGTEITNGVNRVTTAPGQAAAAKKDKWLANVTASQDKWARNTARVSLEDWKNYMLNVGVPRVSQGAQAKAGKVGAFMAEFLPFLNTGLQQIGQMRDTTFEERVQKSVAMMRYTHGFKRSGTA